MCILLDSHLKVACVGKKGSYSSYIGVCIQGLHMFWGLLSDVNKHMRHIVQCRQLFVCATCLSLFCLQEMQQGVNNILPSSVFDSLTPEDLHLLMNGSPVVDVEVLKKIMSFMDKSRECHMTPGACHLAGVAHASPFPCVSCV